jgi:hypothetical protein
MVFSQYQPTDARNKIQFMTGIGLGTGVTSSVVFFVSTASDSLLLKKSCHRTLPSGMHFLG